ncbi:hypothetical protein AVEN_115827-1, partial [Araneus ventricosus]
MAKVWLLQEGWLGSQRLGARGAIAMKMLAQGDENWQCWVRAGLA